MSNLTIHRDIRLELQLMLFSDMFIDVAKNVIFIKSVKGYGA